MAFLLASWHSITGKRIVAVHEITVADVDSPSRHCLTMRFDDDSELSIDLLSVAGLSYTDPKQRKTKRRRG